MRSGIRVGSRGAHGRPWWQRDAVFFGALALCIIVVPWLGRPRHGGPLDADNLFDRNTALRRHVQELEIEQLLQRERIREHTRLLGLRRVAKELAGRGLVFEPAYAAPERGSRITLGRGQLSGVGSRDIVMNPEGLVGRVVAVRMRDCQARLLSDPTVGVAVEVTPSEQSERQDQPTPHGGARGAAATRSATAPEAGGEGAAHGADEAEGGDDGTIHGIVTGGGPDGNLILGYLPPNPDIRRGDAVTSSGMGGVFPEGLAVGSVLEQPISRPGRPEQALVKPWVRWLRLREVLIVHGAAENGDGADAP
jgi:rod shape-determining protein MreC